MPIDERIEISVDSVRIHRDWTIAIMSETIDKDGKLVASWGPKVENKDNLLGLTEPKSASSLSRDPVRITSRTNPEMTNGYPNGGCRDCRPEDGRIQNLSINTAMAPTDFAYRNRLFLLP